MASSSHDTDRYFPNPYLDYEEFCETVPQHKWFIGDDDDFTKEFREKIISFRNSTYQRLLRELDTTPPTSDKSIYTGSSGVAMLNLKLALAPGIPDDGSNMRTMAINLLNGARKEAKASLSAKSRVTFLTGESGPLALLAVAHHHSSVDITLTYVERLLKITPFVADIDSELPDELLYGRAGFLFSLLFTRKHCKHKDVKALDKAIEDVVKAILKSGQAGSKRILSRAPLMYEWHDKAYYGAAHGMVGILHMLMESKTYLSHDELRQLVKPSIDYLMDKTFPSGNLPSSRGSNTDKLVHWCHGAPGAVHMFLKAFQVFGDKKYMDAAKRGGEVIWQRGLVKKGYGICHGVAGNGYAFLHLFQSTGELKYLYRAGRFAQFIFAIGTHGCRQPDRPLSLFEGLSGTIYYLNDLLNPMNARFPGFCI